jgi:putative oxidoreductase
MEDVGMDSGLLVVRLVFGSLMAAHGAQKLFGWFGGYGLAAVSGFFESLGFWPGRFFAPLVGGTELVAGAITALGLFGPTGPALMLAVMIVAAVSVHRQNGLFAATNGLEVPLLNAAAAVTLALAGFGRYSLDAVLGLDSLWTAGVAWSALLLSVAGAVASLGVRRAALRAVPA